MSVVAQASLTLTKAAPKERISDKISYDMTEIIIVIIFISPLQTVPIISYIKIMMYNKLHGCYDFD